MEKFSAFRDPGTGIQPFLTPVPPKASDILDKVALPFGYLLAALRTVFILILALLYVTLVQGVCLLLAPIPPLYRIITGILTSFVSRFILLLVGVWWIPVEVVTRKRGRNVQISSSWRPRAGDIIVSNWVSWIEILWLAFRFNPVFVLPVCGPLPVSLPSTPSAPIAHTPGRRTGTGSAAISSQSRTASARTPIEGFQRVSLINMLRATGHALPYVATSGGSTSTLEEIRRAAGGPVVVFPECTTSNGRGLLRFADVFREYEMPVKGFNVFVMCVRYDPPTNMLPTLSHSIPSSLLNPFPHLLNLASALPPHPISIRLLNASEGPSSPTFVLSEVVSGMNMGQDVLSETCATLIALIGKMKRTGMGWEDKVAFLDFYQGKRK
ncbi:hypothetical protein FIBSPDRAFT_774026 [Athelia psychrophila]|uniref:Phospholipid/glycerol acyltransferase domain-containing protein n=1 Tax=Athelia psychrophila TaxID=1759441 RepID=A0A166VLP6_9AGAM|nr:hypothetical protein FIBSPDRAFT_774026 [Fibularhizoctonia sp. CBS 109695]